MTAREIIFQKPEQKKLKKLPFHIHEKIRNKIHLLKQNPLLGAKLHGELGEYYKIRVGDYRLIYKFNKIAKIVTIVEIEHRQGVYK